MAYNTLIADRIAEMLYEKHINFIEKKMFGGVAFLINEKMCMGVVKDDLMLRVLDEKYVEVVEMSHARPMDFTHKPIAGFVFIEEDGFKTPQELEKWIKLGLEFAEMGIVKSKKKSK